MNTLLLMVLPYKEQYGSFNKISLILFKIAQPTAQVLFFILVNYSNNYVDILQFLRHIHLMMRD